MAILEPPRIAETPRRRPGRCDCQVLCAAGCPLVSVHGWSTKRPTLDVNGQNRQTGLEQGAAKFVPSKDWDRAHRVARMMKKLLRRRCSLVPMVVFEIDLQFS